MCNPISSKIYPTNSRPGCASGFLDSAHKSLLSFFSHQIIIRSRRSHRSEVQIQRFMELIDIKPNIGLHSATHRLNPQRKLKLLVPLMVPSATERLIVWELTIPSWLLKVRHQRYHRLLTRCWPWLTPDTANTCAIDKTWIDDHIWPSIWEHNPCLDHRTHVSTSHKSMVWNMWHTNVSRNSSHIHQC